MGGHWPVDGLRPECTPCPPKCTPRSPSVRPAHAGFTMQSASLAASMQLLPPVLTRAHGRPGSQCAFSLGGRRHPSFNSKPDRHSPAFRGKGTEQRDPMWTLPLLPQEQRRSPSSCVSSGHWPHWPLGPKRPSHVLCLSLECSSYLLSWPKPVCPRVLCVTSPVPKATDILYDSSHKQ